MAAGGTENIRVCTARVWASYQMGSNLLVSMGQQMGFGLICGRIQCGLEGTVNWPSG